MGHERVEININNLDNAYLTNMSQQLLNPEQFNTIELFANTPTGFCTDTFSFTNNTLGNLQNQLLQGQQSNNFDFCSMYFQTLDTNKSFLNKLFNGKLFTNTLSSNKPNSAIKGAYTPSQIINNKQSNMDYIKELNPTMQTKVEQLITFAEANNIPFKITDGYRSREKQLELIEKYKNQPGRAAGADSSPHRFGRAIDIRVSNLSEAQTTKLGNYAKSIGLRWGGDFRTCRERWHFDLPANRC